MAVRLGVPFAIAMLLSSGLAAGAEPAAVKPPANEDCLACHADADAKRANGTSVAFQQAAFEHSTHAPLACVDCHQAVAKLQEFPHEDKLAPVSCAACHDDQAAKYHDSIHAWAKEKAGLTTAAPSCADCHGKHDIRGTDDRDARVYRSNVPKTCGACHQGVVDHYQQGVHAAALKSGNAAAPVCTDCHTAHRIQRADSDAWRLAVTGECGSCHSAVVDSFRRTFHGKVTELGFTRVAACADCHGAHDILPASNPASMVSKARLVETCRKCHAGANAQFVKFDPHPNPRSYARSPVMWWVNRFYTVLIGACFGFFGLHSALWFRRERIERRHAGQHHEKGQS
jgi:nitrate/TMAO reductase-like tetraheme cytochrome c subunit